MLNKIIKELSGRYVVYRTKQTNGETLLTICNKANTPIVSMCVDKEMIITNVRACGSFYLIKEILDLFDVEK